MVAEILFAVFIALLLTVIFTAGFRNPGPWGSLWSFFLIILLVAWLAGVWAGPVGPVLWGVYWAPFLFFGFIAALLLAATTPAPPRRRPPRRPAPPRGDHDVADEGTRVDTLDAEADAAALTVFFWILIFTLIFGIAVAYL